MVNKLYRDVAAVILYNDKNEILLQQKTPDFRWPSYWSLFGGGIRKGEMPSTAAKREVGEELSCDIGIPKFFMSYGYEEESRKGVMYIFTCKFDKPESDISLTEGATCAYKCKTDIEKLDVIPQDLVAIVKYFRN